MKLFTLVIRPLLSLIVFSSLTLSAAAFPVSGITQPSATAVCAGDTAAFVSYDSLIVGTIQWQVSIDGGVTFFSIPGATDSILQFPTASFESGYLYRAYFTDTLGDSDTSLSASLTVFTPSLDTITTTICAGDSFVVGTSAFYTPGTYTDTLYGASVHGCDSIVTLTLSNYSPALDTIITSICFGDSFVIGTTAFHTAGTYTDTLSGASVNGCDSIVTLALSIYAPAAGFASATICAGDSFVLNGMTFDSAGTYTDILPGASVNGCDSLVILTLATYAPAVDTISASICPGDSFAFGTQELYAAGTYTDTLYGASVNGCDSTVTLILGTGNVTPSVTISTGHSHTICAGTVITFTAHPTNGGTAPTYQWYVSGVATDTGVTFVDSTLQNADSVWAVMVSNAPCASVDTVYSNIIPYVVDSPVTPGVSFISTNTGDTICDNTVVNLLATAINGGPNPDFQWQVNGVNVGNSSTYIANPIVNGEVITCILTSDASCLTQQKDTSAPMTFTVIPYPVVAVSQSGGGAVCPGDTVTLTASGGSSYVWSTGDSTQSILSTGGTYRVTATSAYGCTAGSTPITVQVIQAGIDSLTQVGDSLISGTSQFYQWYYDDSIIAGAIGPVYVPTYSGYYQAAVIDSFGCIEYSQVVYIVQAGINSVTADPSVSIFPDPNKGIFTLTLSDQSPQSVTITDALGRVVVNGQQVLGRQQFDLQGVSSGVYYMLITDGHTSRSVKFDIVK